MSEKPIYKEKVKTEAKKPRRFQVLLHNDDYTTMEFVVEVLVVVFRKGAAEATKIMMDVHKKGIGVAGVYAYDIALTKIRQCSLMAKEQGFPLKLSLKEE